jgi:SAM-dependent methyltransferase
VRWVIGQYVPKQYWEERLKSNDGLLGVGYTRLGRRFNGWMYRVRRQGFLREARRAGAVNAEAVLDIGSGTGFYIDCWQALGARQITGLDITSVAVERLSERYPTHRFHELNIAAQDAPAQIGARFDAVSMIDVTYHIVDDADFQRALTNIETLLKPGGVFIFCDFLLHAPPLREQAHVRQRTLSEVQAALDAAGLLVERRVPFFVLMNQPVDSRNPLLKLYWKGLSFAASLHDLLGGMLGALLYPLESLLVTALRESPSTELIVCRKRK